MAVLPHWFKLHHGTGVAVRFFMNDVLFYRHPGFDQFTISGPANYLFVPGENTLRIEILPGVIPATAPDFRGPVELSIMLDNPADTPVALGRWSWENLNEEPPLPAFVNERFRPGGDIREPAFVRARPAVFGPEGLPEQHEAVRRIHEAFRSRDAGAFLDLNALKLAERQSADPGNEYLDTTRQRAKIAQVFQREWDVAPLDMNDLVFESQAGGRVAYVTRKGYGKALMAACRTNDEASTLTWDSDLWLTQVDGAWKVFR
jgi:hypothetical protein